MEGLYLTDLEYFLDGNVSMVRPMPVSPAQMHSQLTIRVIRLVWSVVSETVRERSPC